MLAIRMQRIGRSGHAQFRLIVQEARLSPKSGNVVFALGSYDPHSKVVKLDKEKAAFYLEHGAQPSPRMAVILQKEGVKLPKWVKIDQTKQAIIRNADKRRSTRPAEESVPEAPNDKVPTEEPEVETAEAQTEEATPEAETLVAEVTETPVEEAEEKA
jgi:small subunit ribosomal protein S16